MSESVTVEDAQRKILEDRQQRVGRCQAKIQQALKEEDCMLDAVMIVTANGVEQRINVVPHK